MCTFWLLKPVASKLGTTSHKADLWEKVRVFLSGKPSSSSSEIQFDMVAGDPWGLQLCKKEKYFLYAIWRAFPKIEVSEGWNSNTASKKKILATAI